MKRLAYFMIAIASILLQGVVLPRIFSYGAVPDIFLGWVVVLTLVKGRTWGLIGALGSGILQDTIISNLFGFHIVSYVIVAYICSFWSQTMFEEQWYKTALWMIPSTIINVWVQGILIWIGQEPIQIGWYMWYHGWPSIIWNCLIGGALHKIVWKPEQKEEYLW